MAKIRDRWHPEGLDHLDRNTDRYKLLSAFEELSEYWLVWAAPACCLGCSRKQIEEDEPSFERAIFWHAQDEDIMYGDIFLSPAWEERREEYAESLAGMEVPQTAQDALMDQWFENLPEEAWTQSDDFQIPGMVVYVAYNGDPWPAIRALENNGFYTYWAGNHDTRIIASRDNEMLLKVVESWDAKEVAS